MSIDSRLREGLQRSMSAIDANTEGHFDDARRRGHRRVIVRRGVAVLAVVAAVATVSFAGPAVLDVLRSQRQQPATKPPPTPITGSYSVKITGEEASGLGAPGSAGMWLLTLRADKVLELASLKNTNVGGSSQYQLTGSEMLTTALASPSCTGIGRYRWSRSGSTLAFTLVSDPCALRVAIFSTHPWTAG
jgi:hypothetical protein